MTDAKSDIRAFIAESFLFGDTDSLPADSDSLIEQGIVDSTGVLELVAFIEERFGIRVADAEIVPANLDSIDAIARFAASKSTSIAA